MTQPPRNSDQPTRVIPAQRAVPRPDEIPAATEPPTARRSRLLPSSWPATIGRAQTSTVVLVVLFVVLFALYIWVRPVNTAGAPNPSRQPAVTEPGQEPNDTPAPTSESSPTGTQAPTSSVPPRETEPSTTAPQTSAPSQTAEPTGSSEPQRSSDPGDDDDDSPATPAAPRTSAPGPDSIERAPAASVEVPEPTVAPTG